MGNDHVETPVHASDAHRVINDYIVREFMRDRGQVSLSDDEHLIHAGIIDSLGIFLLIGFLEEAFGILVQPQDVVLENFETVNAIADLVMARQSSVLEPAD